jgi:hypothetical protein
VHSAVGDGARITLAGNGPGTFISFLVLDAGRVIEQGGHAELLARGGIYAGMWQRQQQVRENVHPGEEET